MLVLITGGSGSGKSQYAEKVAVSLAGPKTKDYIATMKIYDEEGRQKVLKHQSMRRDRGFCTIEQPVDIEKVAGETDKTGREGKTALLECVSNLVANEMFRTQHGEDAGTVAEKTIQGVKTLYEAYEHLVIVTNNVFEDGNLYEETTREYIRAMGMVNKGLARMADRVIEVVVGIPLLIKE